MVDKFMQIMLGLCVAILIFLLIIAPWVFIVSGYSSDYCLANGFDTYNPKVDLSTLYNWDKVIITCYKYGTVEKFTPGLVK